MAVEAGKIQELDRACEGREELVKEAQADLKSAFEAVKFAGLHKDAFKAARKLRKMTNNERKAWLDSFHATLDALGLDDQLDLEDAIEAMGAPAGDHGSVTMTVGETTVDLGEASRAIRKARGRSRELN